MRKLIFLLLLLCPLAYSQSNSRFDYAATTTTGNGSLPPVLAIPGAGIQFFSCSGAACTTAAVTFISATSTTQCAANVQVTWQPNGACVATADSQGNFGGWFAPGRYAYTITTRGQTFGPYQFTLGPVGTSSAPSIAVTPQMLKGDNLGNAIAAIPGTDFPGLNSLNNFTQVQTFSSGINVPSGTAVLPGGYIQTSPTGNQTITQSTGTSLSVNVFNGGEYNATSYAGSDIGAKVNTVLGLFPCAKVIIPAGAYTQTTTILKPRCATIEGQGSGLMGTLGTGTVLTSSGIRAMIIADSNLPLGISGTFAGTVRDIRFVGNGTSTGIYIGGDPLGTAAQCYGQSLVSPPVNSSAACLGAHQSFYNVHVKNFADNYQYGNGAWDINWFGGNIQGGTHSGVYFPSTVTNSGEQESFFGTTIAENLSGIQNDGSGQFFAHSAAFDYNTTAATGSSMSFVCTGCHIEQTSYPIISGTGPMKAYLYSSEVIVGAVVGPQPAYIYNSTGETQVRLSTTNLFTHTAIQYCVDTLGSPVNIFIDGMPDNGGTGCTTNTNVSVNTFGVNIIDPLNAQLWSIGVPVNVNGRVNANAGFNVGANVGKSTTVVGLTSCTLTFTAGILTASSGANCP